MSGQAYAYTRQAIQVVSRNDWENHQAFQSAHAGDITAAAWSPNGALLLSAATDRSLVLWDSKSQQAIKR